MTKPKPFLCRLPGAGPWRILEDCPATRHNTLRTAERGAPDDKLRRKCVCPRARALFNDYAQIKKTYREAWYRNNAERHKAGMAAHRYNSVGIKRVATDVDPPSMTDAACRTPEARSLVDASIETPSPDTFRAVQALCLTCPIKQACRAWVLTAEVIPGAWGSVYGGLSPAERKKIAASQGSEVAV